MTRDPHDNDEPSAERPPDADAPTQAFDAHREDELARDAGTDPAPEDEAPRDEPNEQDPAGADDESAAPDADDDAPGTPDRDAATDAPFAADEPDFAEDERAPDPDATEEWAPTEQPTSDHSPARDPELEALRDTSFAVVWRGYDPQAVDAYTAAVVRAVDRFEERTYPTVAVQRALDRVGEQTAAILRQAEQAADETTRASRSKADDRLQRAEREAAEVQAGAIARVRSLDDDIERLWQERQRLIDATKDLAEQLRATALDAEARFPPAEAAPPGGGGGATAAGSAPAGDAPRPSGAPFDAASDPPTREQTSPVDPEEPLS